MAACPLQQTSLTINTKLSSRSLLFTHTTKPNSLSLPTTTTRRRGGAGSVRMMAATAGASYAVALADVAKSNNTLQPTCADVEKLENIFSDESIYKFFANPTVSLEKKMSVVDEMSKSYELQPHVVNFLNILVECNRIELIKDIVKEFELVYNKMTDTEMAVVSSVVKLESDHMAQIAKQVQRLTGAKNVRIKSVIDKSLVAGFTVRYGGSGSKLIDMSVKKQLEDIASQLELGDLQFAAV